MKTIEKPLGKITAVLADLGLEVTYAYDDLVFVQHCAFLLRFTDVPNALHIHTHVDCVEKDAKRVVQRIIEAHDAIGFSVTPAASYALEQNPDETISLTFS